MKICLINPKTDAMISDTVFPPLGLWYLSAALQYFEPEISWDVRIADMAFGDPIPEAEVYGITGTSPQAGRMRNLVQTIRIRFPDAWIIAGGPHATLCPEEVLGYGCDAVLRGEGEYMLGRMEFHRWKGIISRGRILDLDSLPFPDRQHVHRYQYQIAGIPATMMITSRGCPWSCAFCCKPLGSTAALRSVDNILEEVRIIRDAWGYEAINFVDDTLAINRERLFSLADGLGRLGMTWRGQIRAHEASPLLARAMAEGGCVEVGIGIESGSDEILRNVQKGETVEEIEYGVRALQGAGLRVKGFFIIGLPGEDKTSLAHTEALLERLGLDDVDLTILSVYPGSPIYEHPDRYDVQWNGTPTYYKVAPDRYECGVRTAALTQSELLEAREYLERRFKKWD